MFFGFYHWNKFKACSPCSLSTLSIMSHVLDLLFSLVHSLKSVNDYLVVRTYSMWLLYKMLIWEVRYVWKLTLLSLSIKNFVSILHLWYVYKDLRYSPCENLPWIEHIPTHMDRAFIALNLEASKRKGMKNWWCSEIWLYPPACYGYFPIRKW